jgi:hypothetical protein
MQRVAAGQLSFDAAPKSRRRPHMSSVALSGKFGSEQIINEDGEFPQLSHGDDVLVIVQDVDGNLIAQGRGAVSVAFADKELDGEPITIREQKIKL